MKQSRSRYLLTRIALPAFALNACINALLGLLTFPAGKAVPLLGFPSVGADTLVGSFLIAAGTVLGVVPLAGLDGRAGRVDGFGVRRLAWTGKKLALLAIVSGGLWVVAVGMPLMRMLVAEGAPAMPRLTFLAFKAGYAAASGTFVALVAALLGMAPEVPIAGDPHWWPSGSALPPVNYPCDYMDKASLAVAYMERGCTGTPTWRLRVRGSLDPHHVRRALLDLVARYPMLTTRVWGMDGAPPFAREYRYVADPSFSIDRIFHVVDARGDVDRQEEAFRELRSRPLDLFSEFPLSLTLVLTGRESSQLVFRQQHAIADGRAFIGLLSEFASFLNAARASERPSPELLQPFPKRGEIEALGLSGARTLAYGASGASLLVSGLVRSIIKPLVPLLQNVSNDYSGENATIHWQVQDEVLGPWNTLRKERGVSLNTLLTGALFLANQRWHRSEGASLGRTSAQLLMETRPRGDVFASFANHLAFLEVEADLGRAWEPAALFATLHAQAVRQRDRAEPLKRLVCERAFVLGMSLAQMRKIIFETSRPAHSLNFSNLISLEFPTLGGEGWTVEDVFITTPVAPRHGIVLTVIRYAGKITFNFNYKTSAVTRAQASRLCEAFRDVLEAQAAPLGRSAAA